MRSHVTLRRCQKGLSITSFQYRKRYEVTCDEEHTDDSAKILARFQYRKRYEVTCDFLPDFIRFMEVYDPEFFGFQYRKRYEVTCDL